MITLPETAISSITGRDIVKEYYSAKQTRLENNIDSDNEGAALKSEVELDIKKHETEKAPGYDNITP